MQADHNTGTQLTILLVPLERNLHGHTIGWTPMGRKIREFLLEERWEKISRWDRNMQLLFFSVYVDDIKMSGTTNNMPRMWAHLQMKVGFGRARIYA